MTRRIRRVKTGVLIREVDPTYGWTSTRMYRTMSTLTVFFLGGTTVFYPTFNYTDMTTTHFRKDYDR